MDKKINEYKKFLESKIAESKNDEELDFLIKVHSSTMVNFQTERVAHLLVTLSFALFTLIFITIFLLTEILILLVPCLLISVMLIMYVSHYYKLENSIQNLIDTEKKIYEKRTWISNNNQHPQTF